eukprot:TRINITY_DN5779_c0_g1_i2.p1 TRINITY_DN5779_c0_g1~~TRINITY_DN5779_c0_g1_i2.p1  ORF type:complete len:206 (-),score=57.80 TRINITY_DN5779_c0_g1_i2:103-720(-)
MRTCVTGMFNYRDIKQVIDDTLCISRVTHADPRCSASCVLVAATVAFILQGVKINQDVIARILALALDQLQDHPEHRDELLQALSASSLAELELDKAPTIGYTVKCVGAAWFCFKEMVAFLDSHTLQQEDAIVTNKFRQILNDLIMQAGDADTNAAVAGSLMGCLIGYHRLPQDILSQLKEHRWLEEKVDRLIHRIEDKPDRIRP